MKKNYSQLLVEAFDDDQEETDSKKTIDALVNKFKNTKVDRVIWDDCTPTKDRRPTTEKDVREDIHVKDNLTLDTCFDVLGADLGEITEMLIDDGEDPKTITVKDLLNAIINYHSDPGDGSSNIIFLKYKGKVLVDDLESYTNDTTLDGNTCSEDDVINAILSNDDLNGWKVVAIKAVRDSDGFLTEYTWYKKDGRNVFIFGDSDIYNPDEDEPDYETENDKEAKEWFANYNGFEDDDLNESLIKQPIDDLVDTLDSKGVTVSNVEPEDENNYCLEFDGMNQDKLAIADDVICSFVGDKYTWNKDEDGNRISCCVELEDDDIV